MMTQPYCYLQAAYDRFKVQLNLLSSHPFAVELTPPEFILHMHLFSLSYSVFLIVFPRQNACVTTQRAKRWRVWN